MILVWCLGVGMVNSWHAPTFFGIATAIFGGSYHYLASRDASHAGSTSSGIIWLVLIVQNVLAQVVTGPVLGPRASWIEASFSLLYVVLFVASAVIVFHYQFIKSDRLQLGQVNLNY